MKTFELRANILRRNKHQLVSVTGLRKINRWMELIFIYSCSETVKTMDFKRNYINDSEQEYIGCPKNRLPFEVKRWCASSNLNASTS